MNKAIFFDRDGVIIKSITKANKPYAVRLIDEVEFIVENVSYFEKLKELGFYLFLVTNQPDISRGLISIEFVSSVNNMIVDKFNFDSCYVCPHDQKDNCLCRKPKNGLILQAIEEYNLDAMRCFMVGDRWKDIEAANKTNCQSIFIDYGYNEKRPQNPNYIVNNTIEAIEKIFEKSE